MAGLGRKTFIATEVLTAANVNGYLMDQTVMKYANTTAAASAVGTAISEGMQFYLSDTDEQVFYNGSSFAKQNGTTNAIINGGFDIWQRGTSFTNLGNGFYAADRFKFVYGGSSVTNTVTMQSFTPGTAPVSGYESAYFLRYNQTSAGSGQTYNQITQPIEDVRSFAGQTMTFSFWAKTTSGTTTVNPRYLQNFGSGGSSTIEANFGSGPFTITTSWQRFTATLAVPSISGKTIGPNSSFIVALDVLVNTTGTVDTWGWQAELGSVATNFKRNSPSLAGEFAACKRYYQRFNSINLYGLFGFGKAYSTGVLNLVFSLPSEMRSTPNLIETSAMSTIQYETGASSGNTPTSITLNAFTSTPSIVGADLNKSGAFSAGAFYFVQAYNSASAYIGFGAEL